MKMYVILLRGINVGGKNKVSMTELRQYLEELGFKDVVTYINSGNVILRSKLSPKAVAAEIETMLPIKFKLDDSIVKVVALEYETYKSVVEQAPKGFGEDVANYRYNVLFLMNFDLDEAMGQVTARQEVDEVWPGNNVIYFRNSVAQATKSHLSRITLKPVYKSVTIRNWNTTIKLLALLDAHKT